MSTRWRCLENVMIILCHSVSMNKIQIATLFKSRSWHPMLVKFTACCDFLFYVATNTEISQFLHGILKCGHGAKNNYLLHKMFDRDKFSINRHSLRVCLYSLRSFHKVWQSSTVNYSTLKCTRLSLGPTKNMFKLACDNRLKLQPTYILPSFSCL